MTSLEAFAGGTEGLTSGKATPGGSAEGAGDMSRSSFSHLDQASSSQSAGLVEDWILDGRTFLHERARFIRKSMRFISHELWRPCGIDQGSREGIPKYKGSPDMVLKS